MKFNLGEGIYRIVNVICWIWTILVLIVAFNTLKKAFLIDAFIIFFILAFVAPYVFKKVIKYISWRFLNVCL